MNSTTSKSSYFNSRNHITRSNIGDIFIWFSNNEWAASDSDIDILIITKQELSNSIRADLTKQLLKISGSVGCIEKDL